MNKTANRDACAIIVAAGRGTRAGGSQAKQWQTVAGRRVADWTLDAFRNHPRIAQIILVHHPEDEEMARQCLLPAETAVFGGADRAASVAAGLAATGNAEIVLIHDVARPCVTTEVIDAVLKALETNKAAAPAVAVTDALWTGAKGHVTGVQDRTSLYRAQTPQGFHAADIKAAHSAHAGGAADDVEVARAMGLDVAIVPGDEDNLKITTPADFARATRILETRS